MWALSASCRIDLDRIAGSKRRPAAEIRQDTDLTGEGGEKFDGSWFLCRMELARMKQSEPNHGLATHPPHKPLAAHVRRSPPRTSLRCSMNPLPQQPITKPESGGGLFLLRRRTPLPRRSVAYFSSGAHTKWVAWRILAELV